MGSKKSSSASSTTTNTTDNSAVAGNNAIALAAGAEYTNWLQSDDDYSATVIGTDPGLATINAQNTQLLGAVAESQTDAVRFMSASAADLMRGMGASVSSMYDRAGINNVESWQQTTGAAERLLSGAADRMGAAWADTVDASAKLIGATTQAAATTAGAAIAAYQPPEAQTANTARYAMLAVGGLVALVLLPRILKG